MQHIVVRDACMFHHMQTSIRFCELDFHPRKGRQSPVQRCDNGNKKASKGDNDKDAKGEKETPARLRESSRQKRTVQMNFGSIFELIVSPFYLCISISLLRIRLWHRSIDIKSRGLRIITKWNWGTNNFPLFFFWPFYLPLHLRIRRYRWHQSEIWEKVVMIHCWMDNDS